MKKFNIGDLVINKNKIKSITSLINGKYMIEFEGCVGTITEIVGATGSIVQYKKQKIKENNKDLILVKTDPSI